MRKQRRNIIISIILVLLVAGLSLYFAIWGGFLAPKTQTFTSHYLTYQGIESKIYVISETTAYDQTEQIFVAADGQTVALGSRIFIINCTLRNDYSSENPPPSTGTPVTPIDGTAYIRLKATLYSDYQTIPTINITPSHFSTPSIEQTGLVLASGQTSNFQLLLATNETRITGYAVSLEYVGDSISR